MSADVALKAYLNAFNSSDPAALAALYAPVTSYRNPFSPQPLTSPDEVRAFEAPMFDAFSDTSATLEDALADGDRVAARVTIRARHTGDMQTPGGAIVATGTTIELHCAEFIRVDGDGLIVEHHRYFDVASFLGQLGLH